jgi:hypothetical protein
MLPVGLCQVSIIENSNDFSYSIRVPNIQIWSALYILYGLYKQLISLRNLNNILIRYDRYKMTPFEKRLKII